EMVGESVVSPIVPSLGSDSRRRPLLRGVPWVGSPTSSLMYCGAPTSRRPARPRLAQALVPDSRRRRRDLPGSWAILVYVLTSRSPSARYVEVPGPSALGLDVPMLPSAPEMTSAPTHQLFRGLPLSPHTRCLRFVATVARRCLTATQDSLPAS